MVEKVFLKRKVRKEEVKFAKNYKPWIHELERIMVVSTSLNDQLLSVVRVFPSFRVSRTPIEKNTIGRLDTPR